MRRERWYQLVAFALLIAQACACAAAAPASSQAAAFDTLFKRLDGGEIATLSAQQLPQRLTELQRLVPAGDVVRSDTEESNRCEHDGQHCESPTSWASAPPRERFFGRSKKTC